MKAKRKHREETPAFLKPLSMLEPMYKGDLQKDIRAEISRYKELNSRSAVKKFKNKSNIFDLERAMEKRRVQALLNSVNEMPPEYQKYAGDWITLNIVAESYSSLDGEYHIMTAAAIWILDQLYESGASPQDVYQLLPRDGDLLEEL